MDSFINLAKEGFEAYTAQSGGASRTGGEEYNSPHHSQGDYDQGGVDNKAAVHAAHVQSQGSEDPALFQNALNHVHSHRDQHQQPVDEESVTSAHAQAYQQGNASGLDASAMGGAAALEILKQFTSGGGGSGGGNMQTQMISMAMSEASTLFEASGGAASGSKQDCVNGAAMMVMKLMVQSKLGMLGGSDSGGLGGLMGLASKLM